MTYTDDEYERIHGFPRPDRSRTWESFREYVGWDNFYPRDGDPVCVTPGCEHAGVTDRQIALADWWWSMDLHLLYKVLGRRSKGSGPVCVKCLYYVIVARSNQHNPHDDPMSVQALLRYGICPHCASQSCLCGVHGAMNKTSIPALKSKLRTATERVTELETHLELARRGEFVYCFRLQNEPTCKIGFSTWPSKRVGQVASNIGHPLFIHAIQYGTIKHESAIHRRLEQHKVRPEWGFEFFNWDAEDVRDEVESWPKDHGPRDWIGKRSTPTG